MAKEIERKFLVKDDSYKYEAVSKKHIIQGYLSTEIRATIRVRIVDDYAVLTVKIHCRLYGQTLGGRCLHLSCPGTCSRGDRAVITRRTL